FGEEDGTSYVELSGTLAFADIAGIDLPEVSVDGLRITSDGKVSMPAGGLTLQSQETIDLHGFQVQVDSIGFGTEGSERYVSFSGGVKLTDSLPIGVSATGLRVYWSPGGSLDDVRVALDGIGVEFEVPNTLRFEGEVSYVERVLDGEEIYEFEGDVDLTILPLDLAMSARLIVGENESGLKYFLIEVDAPLPMGWPLGS